MEPQEPKESSMLHLLLQQQLRRHFGNVLPGSQSWAEFLAAVNAVYWGADAFQEQSQRSFDVMAREVLERNNELCKQLEARQLAEAQLENLLSLLGATFESAADAILAIDDKGKIVRFNQQFTDMWRIPDSILAFWRHQQVIEHLLPQVKWPERFSKRLEELLADPDTERCEVFECVDGRAIEWRSLPRPAGVDGVGRVLSFHDITARRRAEEALRCEKEAQQVLIKKLEEAHTQLLQSEKMASIGSLAAGVAHEINNPIAFVSSNMTTLRKYLEKLLLIVDMYERAEPKLENDPELIGEIRALKSEVELDYLRRDILDLINESNDGIKRVRQIVQDLKDFAHPDVSDWQDYDLRQGLDSTLNIARNEIKYKAEVVKEYGAIPPVQCLPSQLNQVFMNLLVNAAHAIESRGVIAIRTGANGDQVWVEVSDSGCGIGPENLKRIFDPFFTTKPVGKGTGLGLSVSYGIVERHHGRIEVESEVGKGTTFRVILPLRQEAEAA